MPRAVPYNHGAQGSSPSKYSPGEAGGVSKAALSTSVHLRLSTEGPLFLLEALGQSLRSIYILELSLSSLMEACCLPRFHKHSAFALSWLQDGEL